MLPYPFHHLFSIVTDLDGQFSWHSAAMFRLLNDDIGLPLSGSAWVNDDSNLPTPPSFFRGDLGLNRSASGVTGLPTYGLMMREWHRGELDQLNGWHSDSVYGLHNELKLPVNLAGASTDITLEPGPEQLRSLHYSNLRLSFDAKPPPDLTILAVDDQGHKAVANLFAVSRGAKVQYLPSKPYWVEIIFHPDSASQLRGIEIDPGFRLGGLSEIRLIAPSCKSGCSASVVGVERDAFSRQTVLDQISWLQAWNIRPPIYTWHVGFTMTDMPWRPGAPDMDLPGVDSSPVVTTRVRGLIDQPFSFAYIVDQLHGLGVDFIAPYSGSQHGAWNQVWSPLKQGLTEFYDLEQGNAPDVPTDSIGSYSNAMRQLFPTLEKSLIAENFRSHARWNRGTMIGLLVGVAFDEIKKGHAFNCICSTHFAVSDGDWSATAGKPLERPDVDMLRRLANHYYDFDGRIEERERIWVPPAGTAARYRVLINSIAAHIKADGNDIVIDPWKDSITGRVIPDLAAGTRDLYGLTIYVPDPEKATVHVGDVLIDSFTRNPADETGQASITVVDDHVPTTIAGALPISRLGPVTTSNAVFNDTPLPSLGINKVATFASLHIPDGGDGWMVVQPRDLVLYNTTHLKVRYRHIGTARPTGRLFVELVLQDERRIALSEGDGLRPPRDAGSGWWIPRSSRDVAVTRTLATTSMLFSTSHGRLELNGRRPPLPIGQVVAVRIGLTGAAKDEGVELQELSALRPSGDAVAPDGSVLLAGRVTNDGVPLPNVAVKATPVSGSPQVVLSDEEGLYFFTGLTKGDPVYVSAEDIQHRWCTPEAAPVIDMRRNEAELDIDTGDCHEPPVLVRARVPSAP